MLAINYVSNLPRTLRSGGFSAMNVAAIEVLERHADVYFAGPINPPVPFSRKLISSCLRRGGLPRNFEMISSSRLRRITAAADGTLNRAADLDFFHGFTPWISTRPCRPYVAWSDCSFRDYIEIYHHRRTFRDADLERIEAAEAAWLRGARAVAFTSRWAAERAIHAYDLDPGRVSNVGVFGEIDLPDTDRFNGGSQFAFISTDFRAKGGPVVLEAFRRLRIVCPDATLVLVGDSPQGIRAPGVTCSGFLRKEKPAELARLRSILARSRAVVHPTLSDIAPLLAVEAAYYGCPIITSNRFAIPEIVDHGRTGYLLDDPTDSEQLAEGMRNLLNDDHRYCAMRCAAWHKGRSEHSKELFERRLWTFVEAALN